MTRPVMLAAGGGCAMAATLALAETLLGALAGQATPWIWWPRLAACYAAPLMGLAVLCAWVQPLLRRPDAPGAALLTLHGLVFLHTTTVLLQDFVPGEPILSPVRLAGLALVGLLVLLSLRSLASRDDVGSWLDAAVASFVLPIASFAASVMVHEGPSRAGLAVLLPLATVRAALATPRLTGRSPAARALGAALVVGLASLASPLPGLWGRAPSPPLFRKAEPQAQPGAERAARGRPHVLLIVLDTLRARNLSCYGYARPTTPHIDAFAREGVLYSNFVATAPWTTPSHASLFTGLYALRHGADNPPLTRWQPHAAAFPLAESFETLAESLGRAGYATAAISANSRLDRSTGLDQGFRDYDASPALESKTLLMRMAPRLPRARPSRRIQEWFARLSRPADDVVRQAMFWIESRPAGQPYFLFLNFMDMHAPYLPRTIGDDWILPGGGTGMTGWGLPQQAVDEIFSGRRQIDAAEAQQLTALYDAALRDLDEALGELLAGLRRRPDYDNTWIVLTADHGEALGEHGTLGHSVSLYQELLHCPLIIHYPRSIASMPGTRDPRPVQTVDILPTLLDGIGLAPPAELDGVPIRRGRALMFAEASVTGLAGAFPARFGRELRAVLEGTLKYIESSDGRGELYDLRDDPLETRDIAAERPDAAARLRGRIAAWRAQSASPRDVRREAPARLTPQQREQLRALGYAR